MMTDIEKPRRPRGFAAMSPERQRALASKGGKAVPPEKRTFAADPSLAKRAGRVGGKRSSGSFTASDPERARTAGRRGGQINAARFKEMGEAGDAQEEADVY